MSEAAPETILAPFSAFNFAVEINIPDIGLVCNASFAECDGLEISREVKTIREGGNNTEQIRLSGAANYAPLTLKRGMTSSFDLWKWFEKSLSDPSLRASAEVVLFASERGEARDKRPERARFVLSGCLPVKFKAPPMNAKDGTIAIEEFQMVYAKLSLKPGKISSNLGAHGHAAKQQFF
jgi:phage tail-like protein